MSRRNTRKNPARAARPAAAVTATSPCPCGLAAPYGECCGRFHSGPANAAGAPTAPTAPTVPTAPTAPTVPTAPTAPTVPTAPTAELLMRSRYSAFVVRDAAYLLRTWAPETRPGEVDFDPSLRWAGLEIRDTTDGTAFHQTGTVTFVARYTHAGEQGALHERSRFRRHEGAWVYVDGDFIDEADGADGPEGADEVDKP
ncbi:YchJ family metal-binding protein [Streptomyces sp. NPDC002992]|uniref:YchJ family protein n=1 Tax=Streptomyces sp. NPDC002992 TaxID=3154273 RepID=UPI0033A56B95